MSRTLIWDIETDGLLPKLTRVTSLVIRDAETRETFVFRRHEGYNRREHDATFNLDKPFGAIDESIPDEWVEPEDTIVDGILMLEEADHIIGHNIIQFDIPAVKKVYPGWSPRGKVTDTLVMTRLLRPDIKDGDFALHRKGILPGKLIGKHNLDSWGYRLGKRKGDYAKLMEERGLNPWGGWNQSLEDYCVNDVDVTELLWAAISGERIAEESVTLEHAIHDVTGVMERNGFPFDVAGAQALAAKLQSDKAALVAETRAIYGPWLAPKKKRYVNIMWDDPKGANRKKYKKEMALPDDDKGENSRRQYYPPRPEYGEDMSRAVWGDVKIWNGPENWDEEKQRAKDPAKPVRFKGSMYVPIEWKEFNPGSRPQIIDRFVANHDWIPQEFTDNGSPKVSYEILMGLGDKEAPRLSAEEVEEVVKLFPAAPKIAECLFVSKLIGYLETGGESWYKHYNPDTGRIHPHTITGGTISGRCAHAGPNIGQVPAVVVEDVRKKDGSYNPKVLDDRGVPILDCFNEDGTERKKIVLKGRAGEYGYECRSLFHVPEYIDGVRWRQVGIDLSGIEFRCLAELTSKFDDGELIEVVVRSARDPKNNPDIHTFNARKTGLNRDTAKRLLYALMYGAGDWKLGFTAMPIGTVEAQKRLGAQLRATLMEGLPALKRAIDQVKRQAQHGFLIGLDGRRLWVRSEHSALNLRLQSDAALIAKKWTILTEQYALDAGMDHGWDGDFAMLAMVHDEIQNAVRADAAEEFAKLSIKAAADAGLHFKFRCPVDAEAKFGQNWMECH